MPRKARQKSESGIYHIIMRGINRQVIFEEENDYSQFLKTLQRYKAKCGYEIYAYCLMGNHIHLLLKTGTEPLEQIMRRIGGSYVYWYNNKYQRVGNLFQDRFKSEPVEDERYLQTVQRYIHQNPVKAGLVKQIQDYMWSSYHEYLKAANLVDVKFILEIISNDRKMAIQNFIEYTTTVNDNNCLDINHENKHQMPDEEAQEIIKQVCRVKNALDLQKLKIVDRNQYLKKLKGKYNLSVRQLERLTGINRGIILRT